jgi:signal recognition particle receptor subunit beta
VSHYKIVFSGPVGAGKTTAIASISDITPITTETRPTDETKDVKATTTIAMDYGVLRLDGADRIHLYGTPGQNRFDFMRHILAEKAIGVVLLMANTRPTPLADLNEFVGAFRAIIDETALAVGVTGMDLRRTVSLDDYRQVLTRVGIIAPVFEIDARRRSDVALLIQALLLSIDPGIAGEMSPPGAGPDTVRRAAHDYW